MPSLRTVWKDAAETLMHTPMRRVAKRREEAPRNVESAVGSSAKRLETRYNLGFGERRASLRLVMRAWG